MEENNFYTDISSSVKKIFSFLQTEFGFSEFKEKQLAYEIHLITKNKFATIDIWFEAISSTPIWAKINDYYIDNLELENSIIKEYQEKLSRKYNKQLNDKYLNEISEILQRHPNVLHGNMELLQSNTEIIIHKNQLIKDKERIESGIYTIEYQFFSTEEYDCYEEFENINKIKPFLAERPEIKVFRVLDCYMNEIDIKLLD